MHLEELHLSMGKRRRSTVKGQPGKSTYFLGKSSLGIIGAISIVICLITFLMYAPALKNNFVNWDDDVYVYENSNIHSFNADTLWWMLTALHGGNWHPLTWLSHAADYAIWGRNPFGHHLTSIILHVLNTFLVFLVVIQLVLRAAKINASPSASRFSYSTFVQSLIAAGIAALLFGVHPLHVESVAWVAERKDLLCAFFFLLTLCCYFFYTSSVATKNRRVWFTACIALSAAALMAKPMAVTIPLVLLLLDMYPLKRMTFSVGTGQVLRVVLEKVPFCLLSIISAILTILAQHAGGAFQGLERPLYFKLANALYSPFFYLAKLLWPGGLVPFYPFPKAISVIDLTYYGISGILALGITGGCIWLWNNGRQMFLIVWAYYLITLLPVAGIIQVGVQAAADRYTYLPSVSIFVLAGTGVAQLYAAAGHRRNIITSMGLILVVIFIAFTQLTAKQIKVWRNSETLWRRVIEKYPGRVHFAHLHLGNAYMRQAQYDNAAEEYEKAVAIYPAYANAHNNLGNAYVRQGQYDKALAAYEKAVAINPHLAEAHNNLALIYYAGRNYGLAKDHLDRALALGYKVSPQLLELITSVQPSLQVH